jgi:S1-C subfamily serine protease
VSRAKPAQARQILKERGGEPMDRGRPMVLDYRAFVLLALLSPAVAAADGPPGREVLILQQAVERAIARVEPGVVCIATGHDVDFERQPDAVPESYGTGLVIDEKDGLILTCAHVVRNRGRIDVRLAGGVRSSAEIHALDPRSDLAVLQLKRVLPRLRAVQFGDGGSLKKGQFVVGLANPYRAGYHDGSPSASWGIVSNLTRRAPGVIRETDRNLQSFHRYGTLVQTDVRIALGCSGGAIINLDGEVVGITTALAALEGIDAPGGFAMPVDDRMRQIIEVLRRGEEVEYGFLGVILDPRPYRDGAHIEQPIHNGPAEHAGLRRSDVLVNINGRPVHSNDDLFFNIGSLTVGAEVTLRVRRGNEIVALGPVKLGKLYIAEPSIASQKSPAPGGLRVEYASVFAQRSLGQGIPDGVMIREILPSSAASRVDLLQPDRIITRVNDTPVRTPLDFYKEVDKSGDRMELTVIDSEHRETKVVLELR